MILDTYWASNGNYILDSQAVASGASTVTMVSVTPGTATGSQQFTATVVGTNSPRQAVTWATNLGSISNTGYFTAPAATAAQQTATITATSVQDGTKSGTATSTIAAAASSTVTSVNVSPSNATGSQQFSASVIGTNSPSQSVTWTATAGSIDNTGYFTAPAATPATQTINIIARSTQDSTVYGTASATIAGTNPVVVTGAPDYASYSKPKTYAVKRGDQTFVYTSKERAMAAFKAEMEAEQVRESVPIKTKRVVMQEPKIAPGDWDSMLKMLDGMNGNYDMNKINRFL